MRKSMLLTLFLAFLLAATLQVRLTAKPQSDAPEPQAESKAESKAKSVAVTDEKPPSLDAETEKLIALAESMVTLPDITAERLRDVASDLEKPRNGNDLNEKAREPINRVLVKVYDKIIALKPGDTILVNAYDRKQYVLHDIIRARYADEDIAALEQFADETDNAGIGRIDWIRGSAKSWAKRTKIWQMERRENPTVDKFLALRKEIVDFVSEALKQDSFVDTYMTGDLVRVAEQLWTKNVLSLDQMLETFEQTIASLENSERDSEIKSELEARLAFHRLAGKTLEITGTDMDGQPFDWAAYKGKTVLMAFTSSWYGGREMQDVIRLNEEFTGKGLDVVTFVSLTEGHRNGQTGQDQGWLHLMVDRLNYPGVVLTDIQSPEVALQKISAFLGVRQYTFMGATFLLIGADGKVISLVDVDHTRKNLVKMFGEPDQAAVDRGNKLADVYGSVPKPCESNLREIALAMHNYYDVHRIFPPAYTIDDKGNKLHSWRVLLLPYLDQKALYALIRLDEPWNSEYNKRFNDVIVPVFQCHETAFAANPKPITTYTAIVGPGAPFEENGKAIGLADFTDGTSNTLLFVERATPVNWMDPTDITFDEAIKGVGVSASGIAGPHNGGSNCAFCDGSTRFLPGDIDLKLLRAIITRSGGEAVSFPE